MNIWEIYLVGIMASIGWSIIDFFKYRKIALNREYYRESPNKLAFKTSFKEFLSNTWIIISFVAAIYVVGYILTLAFVDAIPHF